MRSTLILLPFLLLFPGLALAQNTWKSTAKIDLGRLSTSLDLSAIISTITDEWALAGGSSEEGEESFVCYYRSYISQSTVEKKILKAVIFFEFKGDTKFCGDGEANLRLKWEDVAELEHVKLSDFKRSWKLSSYQVR